MASALALTLLAGGNSLAQTNAASVAVPSTNAPDNAAVAVPADMASALAPIVTNAPSAATTNLAPATNAAPSASASAIQIPALTATETTPAPSAPPLLQRVPTPPADTGADQLADIRPPYFYLPMWSWLWLVLALMAIVSLLVLAGFWVFARHRLSPRSAYDLALERLQQARALLREDNPMPYAVAVSEIIRTYLGQRFQTPSTRRTTEEFLRLMQANVDAPLAQHRALLRDFLQACDLVKFGRYAPTQTELEQVQDRATSFVTATRPEEAALNGHAR